ncbi:MAG: hypothetical protein NVSMB64_30210 [Candidatus Velthaea sp.]
MIWLEPHLGLRRATLGKKVSTPGSSIGPPWTKDYKGAALAAPIVPAIAGAAVPTAARNTGF